jgi:hypothetical protein
VAAAAEVPAAGGDGGTATLLQQAQQLVAAGHDRAVSLLQLHGGLEQQLGPGGAAAQEAQLQLQQLLALCLGGSWALTWRASSPSRVTCGVRGRAGVGGS